MKIPILNSLYKSLKFSITLKWLRISFFFMVFLFIPKSIFAQTKFWESIDKEPTTLGIRQIIPEKYRVFKLNNPSIQTFLSQTPMEFTAAAKSANTVLELPMPDGSFQQFAIFESPIMEAGLAKQFPDIKTYGGYSLENKATTVRFDFTQFGFHAMILSPEGTFFIDPYSNATTEYYISYDKKDFTTKKTFSCSIDSIHQPEIDSTNKKQNPRNKIDSPMAVNASYGDGVLRTYRLALAATGEYTTFHGGTIAGALAAQVTTMNRVNGVFLKDFSVRMNLIANNNLIIYTNAATDPYTNANGNTMLSQNQSNVDAVIGSANYDIGHVFSTGGGGVAYLNSPCSSFKAGGVTGSSSPVGDAYDIDYVAHEIGHQFGGNHTFNNSCSLNINSATAFEPGSGTTIMSYAGVCSPNVQSHSDAYFHGGNFPEMHTFITGTGNTCATKPAYINAKPIISSATASQAIPKGTPFLLTSTATDTDGNASLTYCWEQIDNQTSTQPPVSAAIGGPSFRSFDPSSNGTRYFPRLSDLVNNASPTWEVLPTVARSLNFRLIVRDNAAGGGSNDHVDVLLTVDATSGPLLVTIPSATGISWNGLSSQTITWDVANTNIAPVSCANVDILLSTDGGLTYPTTIASNVPNSGSAIVTIPNMPTTTARIMVKGSGKVFFDISNNNFTILCPATSANIPTGVSASPTNICSGLSTSLSATCASGTITWYNALTGGTALGTGNAFSQSPTINTTYYASCENDACKSDRVATSQVVVTAQPTLPTGVSASPTNICNGSSTSLLATCTLGTITWYNASTGGTALGTGNAFPQNPTVNTTYYASCENGACKSDRVATSQVVVTAQPTLPTAVSVSSTAICSGTNISLSATCASGTITWYNALTGGISLGTGNAFAQSPAINTTYYASCEIGICKSNRIATSLVLVNPPTLNLTTDISSGIILFSAIQTITATNIIMSPAKVTYSAGNAIFLNAGFEAKANTVFMAQIGGCN